MGERLKSAAMIPKLRSERPPGKRDSRPHPSVAIVSLGLPVPSSDAGCAR